MKSYLLALSLLGASLASAQQASTTVQAPQQRMRARGPGNFEQNFEQRLATRLGLNATQQNAVHTAMMESQTQLQGMNQQRRTLHATMVTAIKAGNTDQIDQISQQMSLLNQQETAIRAKTTAKIYATLSADQKTKVGDRVEMLGGPGFGPGMGPGPMRGRRGGAPPQQQQN